MHILFLSDNFPPEVNAAANRVYERAVYWVNWGHKVTVITCAPNFPRGKIYPGYKNKWFQIEYMDGIRIIRVKTFMAENKGFLLRVFDFMSYMVMATIAGIFEKKHEVIVATSPQFFTAVAGWLLGVFKQTPFVFELGDLWPASIRGVMNKRTSVFLDIFEKLELFLYRRSKIIIALTQAFKADLIKRKIPSEKIFVVRNGVKLDVYHPEPKDIHLQNELALGNNLIIGYIGTIGMAHGLENILHTAKILEEKSIKFLLVGEGAEKQKLLQLSEKFNLNNIIFLSQKPKSEIKKYWSVCDLALVHLKNEPIFETVIPSKIFEAMGMGKPIVYVGPEGEASEIIKKTNSGICVCPVDHKTLASTLIDLAQNKQRLAEYSENSKKSAKEFSRENQAREMILALETVFNE